MLQIIAIQVDEWALWDAAITRCHQVSTAISEVNRPTFDTTSTSGAKPDSSLQSPVGSSAHMGRSRPLWPSFQPTYQLTHTHTCRLIITYLSSQHSLLLLDNQKTTISVDQFKIVKFKLKMQLPKL